MKKRDKAQVMQRKEEHRAKRTAAPELKKSKRLQRKEEKRNRKNLAGKKKISFKSLFLDVLFVLVGCGLYGAGLNIFLAPNGIVLGGVSGISIILNHVFPFLSIGFMVLLLNIPLFVVARVMFGKSFFIKTSLATVAFSVLLDVMSIVPKYTENTLLSAIFGGVLCGLGLGIVYARGILTGGTDIVAKVIGRKFPGLPMGQLILIVDAVVILIAGAVYRDVTIMLFSVIAIYLSSQLIDTVLGGPNKAKTAIVVSKQTEEIKQAIINDLKKTATVIKGAGAFHSEETGILLCVVRSHELFKLKTLVHENDPGAFFIVVDATEVMGEGYKVYTKN